MGTSLAGNQSDAAEGHTGTRTAPPPKTPGKGPLRLVAGVVTRSIELGVRLIAQGAQDRVSLTVSVMLVSFALESDS